MTQPWPWYAAGPTIGLLVALLLLLTGKGFGVSSSFQHICAAAFLGRAEYFRYDWKRTGLWNLVFVSGMGAWRLRRWMALREPGAGRDLPGHPRRACRARDPRFRGSRPQ